MSSRDEYERQSVVIGSVVLCAAVFVLVVGLTHWNTAPRMAFPGRGCVLLGAMTSVWAAVTIGGAVIRLRRAAKLSKEEEPRLSAGQLAARHQRNARLGRHLFDVEADRIPDGEAALNAWLDGRAIGPPEETDDPQIVGIYQAADSLPPLFGAQASNTRMGLIVFALGTLFIAICTLFA